MFIVGVGPGAEGYILPVARKIIEEADCLAGAPRHLELFRCLGKEEVVLTGHFAEVISFIKKNKNKKKLVVLVSGDPGMYSLLGRIQQILAPQEYSVIPGISTVQLAFARIGESWQDAKIVSLHGRKNANLAGIVKTTNKLFLFTDSNFPPQNLAVSLLKSGVENKRVVVLENLSYPNERIIDTNLKHLSKMKGFGLCAVIIEDNKTKFRRGKLYGLGLGPGDPRLVTLKAKEILERADTVFVPKSSEDANSWARGIVEAVTTSTKNFVELTFPMTKDQALLNKYWRQAAERIAKEVNLGREVAFVTIGDPLIYSTYIYLLKVLENKFPAIEVETVPGISAFNAAAAILKLPLVEADEKLAVIPMAPDLENLRKIFQDFDTVVLMKVGSKLGQITALLKELGLLKQAVLVSRVGHPDEKIVKNLGSLRDKTCGYLSVIIVRKNKR